MNDTITIKCDLCERIAKLRGITEQLDAIPEWGDYLDEPIGEAMDNVSQAMSNATHYIGKYCDLTHPENFIEREWDESTQKYCLPVGSTNG